jgi:membrane fusion protein, copper/silver efflux system
MSLEQGRRFNAIALAGALAVGLAAGVGGTVAVMHRHEDAGAASARTQYQCPMHPTVVQDHPGDCPICGMKLVAMQAGPGGVAIGPAKEAAAGAAPARATYQCPMHPTVVQDHPGDCPICGMKLVAMQAGPGGAPASDAATTPSGLATVSIDPQRQQLIGLRTASVTRGPVGGNVRTIGRVAMDQTRVKHVNVKVAGFVERIFVDFIGKPVRAGDPLFTLYSPDLVSAQNEYLLALHTHRALSGAGAGGGAGDDLVASSRRRLKLWDVTDAEIEELERTGKPKKTLTIYSPIAGVVNQKTIVEGMTVEAGGMPYEIVDLSLVWVLADVYESELARVHVGDRGTLQLEAYPGRTFEGKVVFIDPTLDPRTRTAKARLEFQNPTGELKPELFGNVRLRGVQRDGLRIPVDAVVPTGAESVVFVALGDGKFQPRAVLLGQGDGEQVEVLAGLAEGDSVVTRANFLVDSESRLKASLAAMSGK